MRPRRVPRRGPQARRRHARGTDARSPALGTLLQMSVSLAARALVAGYGKKHVVDGVDLEVEAGRILLVLGHNGAGKTTLARALFGLLKVAAGAVLLGGRDITGRTPARNVADGFAFVPQGHGVFRTLSVEANLELGGFVERERARLAERRQLVFELFPILAERRAQLAGTLSGGQQQMLAIGRALMAEPALMLLDEPSLGLAPMLVEEIFAMIREVHAGGITVLLADQTAKQALSMADY